MHEKTSKAVDYFFPGLIKCLVQHKRGLVPNFQLLRKMFSYLTMIDDFDEQIEKYWDKYEKKISQWYLAQKKPASEQYLLNNPRLWYNDLDCL